MPEQPRIRRIESFPEHTLRTAESDQAFRTWAESFIASLGNADVIGTGNYSTVYANPARASEFGFAVKDARRASFAAENQPPYEEFAHQNAALSIIETARANGEDVARIPKPYGYVEIEHDGVDRYLLVMERIAGKTFFRYAIEHLARSDDRFLDLRAELATLSDAVLEQELLTRLALHAEPTRTQLIRILDACSRSGYRLPHRTFLQIMYAQLALNRSRFYHRDLHPKNVMLDRSGTPYIIDFGKSVRGSTQMSLSDVYEDYIGDDRIVYQPDAEIGHLLKPFATDAP